jgi:uncharacterized protein YbcI
LSQKSKGTIEDQIANAVVRFHREQQGRGPADARAFLVRDLVVVRCTGILTPTEARLAGSDEGIRLIRSARQELRSINKDEIETIIARITECPVLRSYCDVNVDAAESFEVYVLERNIELTVPQRRDPASSVRVDRG